MLVFDSSGLELGVNNGDCLSWISHKDLKRLLHNTCWYNTILGLLIFIADDDLVWRHSMPKTPSSQHCELEKWIHICMILWPILNWNRKLYPALNYIRCQYYKAAQSNCIYWLMFAKSPSRFLPREDQNMNEITYMYI